MNGSMNGWMDEHAEEVVGDEEMEAASGDHQLRKEGERRQELHDETMCDERVSELSSVGWF